MNSDFIFPFLSIKPHEDKSFFAEEIVFDLIGVFKNSSKFFSKSVTKITS